MALAKRRPTNAEAGARTEVGYSLDWNISSLGNLIGLPVGGRQLLVDLCLMANTDETVGAILWCIGTIMAQLTWGHRPQIDGKDAPDDPQALEAAAFADTLLVDMKRSFADHVDDALAMVWAGFAPCEIVMKQRTKGQSRFTDGLWGVDDAPLRDPLSIYWWTYSQDRRDVIAAQQSTLQGSASIPMWKLLNYRTTTSADKPAGRSLLQNAHRAWRLKTRVQDSEALGIERELCGLPVFRLPQSDIEAASETDDAGNATPAALAAVQRIQNARNAITNLRLNKTGGLLLPSDTYASEDPETRDRTAKYGFEIVTSSGQRSIDARTVVRDYDRAIARTVMMQFLHLGDRSTGSFGLSDDQSQMAIRALEALSIKIGDEWSRKAVRMSFDLSGKDTRYLPLLRASRITKDGVQQLGQLFSGLGKADWLISRDPTARRGIFDAAGLPYDRQAQIDAAAAAGELQDNPPTPGAISPQDPEENQ